MAYSHAINIQQLNLFLLDDLKDLCQKLKVSGAGNKPDIVTTLAAAGIEYTQLQKDHLEHLCRKQGLHVSGNKPDLIERLIKQQQEQQLQTSTSSGKVSS